MISKLAVFISLVAIHSAFDPSMHAMADDESVPASVIQSSIPVPGMTCPMCKAEVLHALKKLPGIISVSIREEQKEVTVAYNPRQVSLEIIKSVINKARFNVPDPESWYKRRKAE